MTGAKPLELQASHAKILAGLFQLLEKAVRSLRMYPHGHPTSDAFLSQTHAGFTDVLSWISPLQITVDRHGLLMDGHTIYTGKENTENLAFLLHRDGIRNVTFRVGLKMEETLELVTAFACDFSGEDQDDDLATYLWNRDLEHFEITVIEDYLEDYLPEELKRADDLAAAIRETLAPEEWSPAELKKRILTPPFARETGTTIPLKQPFLRPENIQIQSHELKHLKELMAREGEDLYFDDMLEIVIEILLREEDGTNLEVFTNLFRNLFQMLLTTGDIEHALVLLRRLRRIIWKEDGLPEGLPDSLEGFFAHLGSPETIDILGESLRRERISTLDSLPSLLALFPSTAIPALVTLFETVPSLRARKVLCLGLAEIGRDDLEALAEQAVGGQWFVVRNVAFTLGLIGTAETVPYLGNLVSHDHPRVRKEALRALSAIGSEAAADWIAGILDHADPETRRLAVQALPRVPRPDLSGRVLEIIRSDAFAGREMKERESFYRLLGGLSTDKLIPEMENQLSPRRWLASRRSREEQHLAAVFLTELNTVEARERLARGLPGAEGKTVAMIRSCLSKPARESNGRGGRVK
jgi:hypothetical protein